MRILYTDRQLIEAHVPFEKLLGANILITGGTGFVGSWMQVAPSFVNLRVLGREQYEYGTWHRQEYDYIIHLANVSPRRVIECANKNGAPILFSSSGAVYDAVPGEYALGKKRYESELLGSGLDVRIARMFSFMGGGMKNHFALTNYIYDAIGGGPIKIRGDNVTRSYLYAADMAVWLWRILIFGQKRAIYEVGAPKPITMRELAEAVSLRFEPEPEIVEERIFGPDARPYYVPSKSLLDQVRKELGVEYYMMLDEGLDKTVAWYKEQTE